MAKWKQVDGDMDFAGTGCTLARVNKAARTVELVRITPWLELDPSVMREGYGLWDVSSTYVDYSEMGVDKRTVRDALKTIDMDEDDYRRLSPENKAAIIAEYSGYSESESVSDFGRALPAPLKQIEFYAGTGLDEDVADINRSMRREATQKLYGGRPNRVPSEKALDFATGGEAVSRKLDDEESEALRYAVAASKSSAPEKEAPHELRASSTQELIAVLKILMATPSPEKLPRELFEKIATVYASEYDLSDDDPEEDARQMMLDNSADARRLAENILEELGF